MQTQTNRSSTARAAVSTVVRASELTQRRLFQNNRTLSWGYVSNARVLPKVDRATCWETRRSSVPRIVRRALRVAAARSDPRMRDAFRRASIVATDQALSAVVPSRPRFAPARSRARERTSGEESVGRSHVVRRARGGRSLVSTSRRFPLRAHWQKPSGVSGCDRVYDTKLTG